jgi:hypothetical protein
MGDLRSLAGIRHPAKKGSRADDELMCHIHLWYQCMKRDTLCIIVNCAEHAVLKFCCNWVAGKLLGRSPYFLQVQARLLRASDEKTGKSKVPERHVY